MLYDMRNHVPQVMEQMLEAYYKGDVEKLDNVKNILRQLLKDTEFFKRHGLIETEKLSQSNKNSDESLSSIRDVVKDDDIKRVWFAIQNIMQGWEMKEQSIEKDYWETVLAEVKKTVDGLDGSE